MYGKLGLLLVLSVGATLSMRVSTVMDALKNKTDILHCEDGKLAGSEELVEVFLPVFLECQLKVGSSDVNKMASCIMAQMGLIDQDGAPNVEAMDKLVKRIFSPDLLDRLPGLKQDVHHCAESFAISYNSVAESSHNHRGLSNFVGCLKEVMNHFGESIEGVCAATGSEKLE